ncbi:flavin reductase [Gordonia spumicola]|uniref:Flavin reductase n=1 Tax=Gordonia spumicola TaxID=589161 RepID=A0A7I9VEW8_9ACTN|nr:flavin reductase family protein [Gordonia spumicola]GEE03663.1 flavin reductase [Gordonia spumicola]
MALPAFSQAQPLEMRNAMGRFMTGVAIVSTGSGDDVCGMTISSLTSISLDPAILMVSLNHGSRTTDMISETRRFTVSILNSRQEAVARHFATRGGSRFETIECDTGEYGLPMIKNALVQAECSVVQDPDVGDHQVFFGQVENLRYRDGSGLVFNAGRFGDFHDFGHDEIPWWF